MRRRKQQGEVYVVSFAPDGVPKTCDGEWAGVLSVHTDKEDAEIAAQDQRDSGVWGDFSHTKEDHPNYDVDNTSSDQGLWIEVEQASLFGMVGEPEESEPDDVEAKKPIEIGDLVRDSHGRTGIVAKEKSTPDADWLRMQQDGRMRSRATDERWLHVLPLTGGAVVSPESLTTRLRRTTAEDFGVAWLAGNGFAKDELDELFPEYTHQAN